MAARAIGPSVYRRLSAANPQSTFAKQTITTVLRRMEQRGYITRTTASQSVTFALTDMGRAKLDLATIHALRLPPKPAYWDGQWRLVMFDIPESKQLARSIFRRTLKRLGFKYLQRSVWVYPHPCEQLLAELADRLAIRDVVVIAITSQLSNGQWLRQQFHLGNIAVESTDQPIAPEQAEYTHLSDQKNSQTIIVPIEHTVGVNEVELLPLTEIED